MRWENLKGKIYYITSTRNVYAPATKHSSPCNMKHNVQISESSRIFDKVLAKHLGKTNDNNRNNINKRICNNYSNIPVKTQCDSLYGNGKHLELQIKAAPDLL
jgi:hypothetical protein